MKLHRKVKHNKKVCRAHDLGSYAQGQGRSQVRGQNLVSAITQKTTEANLTKLNRKIEHNKKVCRAHDLGSSPKVKVTIRSKVKLCLKLCCS